MPLITAPLLALAFVLSAAVRAESLRTGTYLCESARAAGIQGTDGRYAGRIELPAAEQGFGAEIRRLANSRPGCRSSKSAAGRRNTFERWWDCDAALEAVLTKYPQPLRSDDGYIFRDRLSGWLHLADDGRYTFAYTDFARNYYLEEGRCAAK